MRSEELEIVDNRKIPQDWKVFSPNGVEESVCEFETVTTAKPAVQLPPTRPGIEPPPPDPSRVYRLTILARSPSCTSGQEPVLHALNREMICAAAKYPGIVLGIASDEVGPRPVRGHGLLHNQPADDPTTRDGRYRREPVRLRRGPGPLNVHRAITMIKNGVPRSCPPRKT